MAINFSVYTKTATAKTNSKKEVCDVTVPVFLDLITDPIFDASKLSTTMANVVQAAINELHPEFKGNADNAQACGRHLKAMDALLRALTEPGTSFTYGGITYHVQRAAPTGAPPIPTPAGTQGPMAGAGTPTAPKK
jgi:hypothetical protein